MNDLTTAIVEHYQKTYELTYELWQQRNRTFLVLLAVIGIATLLTFRAPQADSLLVDFVAKAVGVSDATRSAELRAGFPFALLQSIILMVVFKSRDRSRLWGIASEMKILGRKRKGRFLQGICFRQL